jgi:hypothetical protein
VVLGKNAFPKEGPKLALNLQPSDERVLLGWLHGVYASLTAKTQANKHAYYIMFSKSTATAFFVLIALLASAVATLLGLGYTQILCRPPRGNVLQLCKCSSLFRLRGGGLPFLDLDE